MKSIVHFLINEIQNNKRRSYRIFFYFRSFLKQECENHNNHIFIQHSAARFKIFQIKPVNKSSVLPNMLSTISVFLLKTESFLDGIEQKKRATKKKGICIYFRLYCIQAKTCNCYV